VLKFTSVSTTAVDGVDRKEIRDQVGSTIYHQLLLFAAGSSKLITNSGIYYYHYHLKVTAVVCKSIDLVLGMGSKLS
jgi:hypothetical protein